MISLRPQPTAVTQPSVRPERLGDILPRLLEGYGIEPGSSKPDYGAFSSVRRITTDLAAGVEEPEDASLCTIA